MMLTVRIDFFFLQQKKYWPIRFPGFIGIFVNGWKIYDFPSSHRAESIPEHIFYRFTDDAEVEVSR